MKIGLTIIGLIAISVLMISCQPKEGAKAENTVIDQENQERIYPVKTQEVNYVKIEKHEEFTASINAWEEVHLGPNQPNQIEKIFVDIGDRVKKGDILVKMDASALLQARIKFEDTKRDFQRMDTLIKYGSATQQAYDKAKMAYELSKTALETLQDNVTLTAPFSGLITGKYFNEGEIYSSMAPNPLTGVPCIVSLMQINQLKVIIHVSEKYWPQIKEGMSASLTTEIYPLDKFEGKVHRIFPTIDPASKTFKVEIKVPNRKERLRPGMFAKTSLNFGQTTSILVPSYTVLKQQGTNDRYVFLEDNGKAKKVPVSLGKRYNEKVEITKGLKIGDKLIVTGHSNLMEESLVEVVK